MVTENIFINSTLHLFHRYKKTMVVFIATALIGVTVHHYFFPSYLATASLRVNPTAGNYMALGKGIDFGGMSNEPDYVRYLKLMKSVNFRKYIKDQLSQDSEFKSKVAGIYGSQGNDEESYTDLIFNDFDFFGRENDIIDIVATNKSSDNAVNLANLVANKARAYMLENEALDADETIAYLNKQVQNQQERIDSFNHQVESTYAYDGSGSGPTTTEQALSALMQDLNSTRVKIRENGYLALEIIEQIKGAGTSPEAQRQLTSDENIRGRLIDKLRDLKEEDKAFKSKARALEEQIKTLQAQIDPHQETKTASLQKKLGLEQDIYFTLKKKIFDYEVYKVALGSHVRVYSDAIPNAVIRKLSLAKKLVLTLVLSLLTAFLGVVLREKLNPTVCHGLHLKTLGIGFLTTIPDLSKANLKTNEKSPHPLLIENFAMKNKQTMPFLFLRLKVLQLFRKREQAPLAFTLMSASLGQGKSVLAANMASCFDFYEMKTILVDCDSDHSGMGQFFKPEHNVGFSDLVDGKATLAEVIQKTQVGRVDFIAAGNHQAFAPGHFQKRVQEITAQLKESYDIIIFNAPDFFESDNAVAIGDSSDMVIAVVDAFNTRLSHLSSVVNALRLSNIRNIYGVINRAEDYLGINNTALETIDTDRRKIVALQKGA